MLVHAGVGLPKKGTCLAVYSGLGPPPLKPIGLRLVSVAVTKHRDQKQYGEERLYLA